MLLVHTEFILVTNNIVRRSGRESAWAWSSEKKNTEYCVFQIYKYIYIRVQIDIYIFNCACSPPHARCGQLLSLLDGKEDLGLAEKGLRYSA